LVLKYSNLSPATAKGHLKRPCHGIQSTTTKTKAAPPLHVINDAPIVLIPPPLLVASNDTGGDRIEPPLEHQQGPNEIINDDGDNSVANIFAFGAFANEHSSIVHHNRTGLFPFVSLDSSMCFFVLYHYKLKGIIADPIKGLEDKLYSRHTKISLISSPSRVSRLSSTSWTIKALNILNNCSHL
jgi:hypothetical protein